MQETRERREDRLETHDEQQASASSEATQGKTTQRHFSKQDEISFHEDLRLRNPVFLWTVLVFNPVYVGWTVFDYLLVRDQWLFFLQLRLAVAVLTSAIAVWVSRPKFRRYSWEAVWLLAVVYCGGIAPMLPYAGGANLSRYVMGFIFVIITAGLIPFWPPRWPASAILVSVILTAVNFLGTWDEQKNPVGDVVSALFVVITASTLSVVAALFKYNLMRRDYGARLQIADVAKRESDARKSLSETSHELQAALERLEELDQLKNRFFANISHELRTPLTLILAPVDQLDGAIRSDEGKAQLRVIRRNAERLLGLINDLLDLSKLDAGGLRLNVAEMDIRSVASAVVEDAGPAAANKGIDFRMRAEPTTQRVFGDAHRLEIVLTNLVANAIKFTPLGGRIDLLVWDGEDGVNVEVRNSGSGIAPEDLPRIFDRFFQVAQGDRRREGGVGIGLALAKELVELHGGCISAESIPGVTTTFRVSIPFGPEHIRPEVIERRQQFEQSPGPGRRAEDQWKRLSTEELVLPLAPGGKATAQPAETTPGHRPRILLVEDHDDAVAGVGGFLQGIADGGGFADRSRVPRGIVREVEQHDLLADRSFRERGFESLHIVGAAHEGIVGSEPAAEGLGEDQIVVVPVQIRNDDLIALVDEQIRTHREGVGQRRCDDGQAVALSREARVLDGEQFLPLFAQAGQAGARRVEKRIARQRHEGLQCFEGQGRSVFFERGADGGVDLPAFGFGALSQNAFRRKEDAFSFF